MSKRVGLIKFLSLSILVSMLWATSVSAGIEPAELKSHFTEYCDAVPNDMIHSQELGIFDVYWKHASEKHFVEILIKHDEFDCGTFFKSYEDSPEGQMKKFLLSEASHIQAHLEFENGLVLAAWHSLPIETAAIATISQFPNCFRRNSAPANECQNSIYNWIQNYTTEFRFRKSKDSASEILVLINKDIYLLTRDLRKYGVKLND